MDSPLLSRPGFLASLACMLVHEMDAVREREWTGLFPFLLIKDDELAHWVFTGVHVPLYAYLLVVFARNNPTAHKAASLFGMFAVGHSIVHGIYRYNNWLGFKTTFSKSLIWGSAVFAAADLFTLQETKK